MSIHHLERAAELALPAAKKLVFMALCDSADKDTRVGLPGFEIIVKWSNLGRSQAHAVVKELIDEGYVARVKVGRKGQRAEYRVFDRIACCTDHGPYRHTSELESGSDPLDPIHASAPVDNPPALGSGQPDSDGHRVRLGSGKGSGQGPVQTGPLPVLPTFPKGGAGANESGSPVPAPVDNPLRCKAHQQPEDPGPCGACGAARRAHQDQVQADELAIRRRHTQERADAAAESKRIRAEAIDGCTDCDDVGRLPSRELCLHDGGAAAAAGRSGAALARQLFLHPPQGTVTCTDAAAHDPHVWHGNDTAWLCRGITTSTATKEASL